MPDLSFEVVSAEPARDVITPAISFELRVSNCFPEQRIHAVLLRCQIQIETAKRRYSAEEQQQLRDLFDEPSRWGDTLRPMTWANISVNIPAFLDSTVFPLMVPCSFDFSVATAKYFRGVAGGDVPLTFLFSGSVFHDAGAGALQVAPISWSKEARFRLPVATWQALMDLHYPNTVMLHLRRDVFEELYRFKMALGAASFDDVIQRMLTAAERERRI